MERIQISEVSLELLTAGDGPPLLFLHGGDYFAQHREFFDKLARHWRVIVPRHPGFGNSERPEGSAPSTISLTSISTCWNGRISAR